MAIFTSNGSNGVLLAFLLPEPFFLTTFGWLLSSVGRAMES